MPLPDGSCECGHAAHTRIGHTKITCDECTINRLRRPTMSVRAKMRLSSITEEKWGPGGNKTTYLNFSSQYDTSIPEDRRFQKATPNATARFQVDNPDALAQFEAGKDYYLDFTDATPPEPTGTP
jgi:hypothetical protein